LTQQDVLEMLNQRPFLPFRIHVSDGTVSEIRHPEMSLDALDRDKAVALLHNIRLEPIEPSAL
jgi:hypothetical protein